jgi:hypothetical protein
MTPAEFVVEALTFKLGELVVVSGPDAGQLAALLSGAQAARASSGLSAIVLNSRDTDKYERRLYRSCDATIHGLCAAMSGSDEAVIWESKAKLAAGSDVLLISNEFDAGDRAVNLTNRGLSVDVVVDLMELYNVRIVLFPHSRKYPGKRELYPFVSRIYYYDGSAVTFIKSRLPEVPLGAAPAPVVEMINSSAGGAAPQGPQGPYVGRTLVTVTGQNFSPGAKVWFGGRAATGVNVVNTVTISCLTPSHFPGVVDVAVTNTDGQVGTLAAAFYFCPGSC